MTTLIKALNGMVAMNSELSVLFADMVKNVIPSAWTGVSYNSLKPLGSYILDLVKRLKFFAKWIEDDSPPTFWLSGFYFT